MASCQSVPARFWQRIQKNKQNLEKVRTVILALAIFFSLRSVEKNLSCHWLGPGRALPTEIQKKKSLHGMLQIPGGDYLLLQFFTLSSFPIFPPCSLP